MILAGNAAETRIVIVPGGNATVSVDDVRPASAKPADLPVERPTKLERLVDLRTAKSVGLTIPQSLLARADDVIR